jgi:class 3 adenylate cyclase
MLEGLSVKLSKYLSPQIYNSIFTGEQDVSLTTKRKKLTVFFSDLKDFTKTTEGLQPEDLTGVLNNYFSEMSTIALAHGATIDKFIGDAMMIFFGDPESNGVKEDASACVRMAVEMQRRMEDLQQSWRDSGMENPWEMRIGINTGYCNVGNFGSVDRMDYTIIGGEVNLSARLEGKSDPGGILMSYETYALVKDLITAEEQKPMTVKGIAREIRPFAVTNIYENLDDERRFIRRETEAMQLAVDLDKLTGEQRTKAIYELEGVLERIKREA